MPMQNALAGDDCRTHKSLAAQMETSSATGVARLPARAKAASLPEIGSGDATDPSRCRSTSRSAARIAGRTSDANGKDFRGL